MVSIPEGREDRSDSDSGGFFYSFVFVSLLFFYNVTGAFWNCENDPKLATLRLVIRHFANIYKRELPFEGQHRTQ